MTRAFSLSSDGLGALLGFALVRSDSVAIVSPWLSDVRVPLPMTETERELPRRARLSTVLSTVETEVQVYLRDGESHNDYVRHRLPEHVRVERVDDLHAKAIVTPEFRYVGSANITRGGLRDNRELCEVVENEFGGVGPFLDAELQLDW